MTETWKVWTVIILVGLGSYALRFVFLGLVGDRTLPPWLSRHLRYTAVAVLPGLVAPLVIWPPATGGALDLPRLFAALATLIAGLLTHNVILSVLTGGLGLYAGLYFLG